MSATSQLAIAPGSLIVVTGANGYIASHVVEVLLKSGYKVRGTIRSLSRASWLQSYFDAHYGPGNFSLVEVPDMAQPGAFDQALKGASGVAHVATPVMQFFDPNEGVPSVVDGILNVLKAATKEPSIKRVVLTSSSTAASNPKPNKEFVIDSDTWNDEAVKAAWAPPPYEGLQRRLDVYSASKTQAEQAAWKFMKEQNPSFDLNTVLPNANLGRIISPEHQGFPSTAGWVQALWNGFEDQKDLEYNPPQYYVNVEDDARVHVAALIYDDVRMERLFAFAQPFNWNTMLQAFRELYPNKTFRDDYADMGNDLSKVANERAEELLKRFGREGWTSLKDSIKPITDQLK